MVQHAAGRTRTLLSESAQLVDDSDHSVGWSRTSVDSANNSGSVIGVLCRYRTFGLSAKSVAARIAPVREPEIFLTIAAMHATVIANDATEIAIANAPVRYIQSICIGSAFSTCGSGSHTAPICSQLGVRLSKMRRATTRWALAS